MEYDIFISYSRKDIQLAKQIKAEIEQSTSANCWMDLNGIESGEQFDEKIIYAIENSPVFLFLLSENSMQSKWTKKEINYANNTKKKIVPININECTPKGWYLFYFGGIDIISYSSLEQKKKLMRDLTSWCNIESVKVKTETKKTNNQEVKLNTEDTQHANNYNNPSIGSKIHIKADADCKVFDYGINIKDVVKANQDSVIYLEKGVHELKFVSIEEPTIFFETDYNVEGLGKITVELQANISHVIFKRKLDLEKQNVEKYLNDYEMISRLEKCLPQKISFTVDKVPITFTLDYLKTKYEVKRSDVIKLFSQESSSSLNDIVDIIKVLYNSRINSHYLNAVKIDEKIRALAEHEGLLIRIFEKANIYSIPVSGPIWSNNIVYFKLKYIKE